MSVAAARLAGSGDLAQIAHDPLLPGTFTLAVAGAVQSHVDLGDPSSLFHDYVRRLGNAIDRIRLPGEPLVVVHLGAGALTLARYVQATRPGSEQHVVELEADLVPFVTEHLPLPSGTDLTLHPGDAADRVAALARPGILGGRADVVLADLYRGTTTPAHLTTSAFFADAARLLAPEGVLAVNVADDDGLPALRHQLTGLREVFGCIVLLGPTRVLTDARAGNAVVLASHSPALLGWASALRAAGPHPGLVITADEFEPPEQARQEEAGPEQRGPEQRGPEQAAPAASAVPTAPAAPEQSENRDTTGRPGRGEAGA